MKVRILTGTAGLVLLVILTVLMGTAAAAAKEDGMLSDAGAECSLTLQIYNGINWNDYEDGWLDRGVTIHIRLEKDPEEGTQPGLEIPGDGITEITLLRGGGSWNFPTVTLNPILFTRPGTYWLRMSHAAELETTFFTEAGRDRSPYLEVTVDDQLEVTEIKIGTSKRLMWPISHQQAQFYQLSVNGYTKPYNAEIEFQVSNAFEPPQAWSPSYTYTIEQIGGPDCGPVPDVTVTSFSDGAAVTAFRPMLPEYGEYTFRVTQTANNPPEGLVPAVQGTVTVSFTDPITAEPEYPVLTFVNQMAGQPVQYEPEIVLYRNVVGTYGVSIDELGFSNCSVPPDLPVSVELSTDNDEICKITDGTRRTFITSGISPAFWVGDTASVAYPISFQKEGQLRLTLSPCGGTHGIVFKDLDILLTAGANPVRPDPDSAPVSIPMRTGSLMGGYYNQDLIFTPEIKVTYEGALPDGFTPPDAQFEYELISTDVEPDPERAANPHAFISQTSGTGKVTGDGQQELEPIGIIPAYDQKYYATTYTFRVRQTGVSSPYVIPDTEEKTFTIEAYSGTPDVALFGGGLEFSAYNIFLEPQSEAVEFINRCVESPAVVYEKDDGTRSDSAQFVNGYYPPRISTEASGTDTISAGARFRIPPVIAELIEKVRGKAA